jgi:hypothetical protein
MPRLRHPHRRSGRTGYPGCPLTAPPATYGAPAALPCGVPLTGRARDDCAPIRNNGLVIVLERSDAGMGLSEVRAVLRPASSMLPLLDRRRLGRRCSWVAKRCHTQTLPSTPSRRWRHSPSWTGSGTRWRPTGVLFGRNSSRPAAGGSIYNRGLRPRRAHPAGRPGRRLLRIAARALTEGTLEGDVVPCLAPRAAGARPSWVRPAGGRPARPRTPRRGCRLLLRASAAASGSSTWPPTWHSRS